MDRDFHYYGTYLAAVTAGFDNKDARVIATSAQFIDDCTEAVTYDWGARGYKPFKFPVTMGTERSEFIPIVTSVYGMKSWVPTSNDDETRQIWMPFHFLPGNFPGQHSTRLEPRGDIAKESLNLDPSDSIGLLCRPRSDTAKSMINFAKDSFARIAKKDKDLSLMLVGSCMHVFADTYAHQDFSGTASYKLNGLKNQVKSNPGVFTNFGSWKGISWSPDEASYKEIAWPVDVVSGDPLNVYPPNTSILGLNLTALGHGQMGHMPDVSTLAIKYQPEWSAKTITRNNPQQYINAFIDMVAALICIRTGGEFNWFESDAEAEKFTQKPKLAPVIERVKQLLSPDTKAAIDQKIYDAGLCVEGSDWFLASEARWTIAISELCAKEGFDPIPGYNEAKFGWIKQANAKKNDGPIPVVDFIKLPYFKWQVGAKLLFRHNYIQL